MELTKLLNEFIAECEYKNLSAITIRNYKSIIGEFINSISITNIEELDRHIIKDYIYNLPIATSSKNQCLRCISAFWHWYEYEYDMDLNIRVKRLKEKQQIKYTPSDEEVKKLKEYYTNKKYIDSRNKTIIYTFVNLGLRGNELINLKKADLDLNNNIITVRNRKGDIDQQLPINKELRLQLIRYVNKYDINSEYLFVSKNNKKMAISNLHYLLSKTRVNNSINPHSLRRYCCTNMLKSGIPITMVSRFMNHSSIEVTNSYYADIKATDIVF